MCVCSCEDTRASVRAYVCLVSAFPHENTHTHTHARKRAHAHTQVDAYNTVDSLIAENFLFEVDHNVTLTRFEPVELLHDVENHPIVGLVRLNEETARVVLKEIFDRFLAIH